MGHKDKGASSRGTQSDENGTRNGGADGRASRNALSGLDLRVIFPLAVLLLLTVLAAGVIPGSLPAAAAIAVIGLIFSRPPLAKTVQAFWWIGIVGVVWLLLTLVPLPLANLGTERVKYFGEMERVLSDRPALPEELSQKDAGTPEAPQVKDADSGEVAWGRLSLNRSGTQRFIILFSLGWSMLWLTGGMNARQRRTFLRVLVSGGTLIALLALLGRFVYPTGNEVWWLFEMSKEIGGQPFVNKNHFASFCAMLIPAGFCLTLAPRLRISRRSGTRRRESAKLGMTNVDDGALAENGEGPSWGQKAGKGGGASQKNAMGHWFFGICLMILVASVVLSLSRGGMLAMLAGILAAGAFWLRGHPVMATAATLLVVATVFAFVFWPGQKVQKRVQTLSDLETAAPFRSQLRDEGMAQWRDFPLVGAGAESFRVLYGVYRNQPGTLAAEYVENEYVQILADMGIIGAILAVLFAISYLACVCGGMSRSDPEQRHKKAGLLSMHGWARARRRKGREEVFAIMAASAVGALVVLCFHFAVDFPTRVPLNAALAGALLGIGMPLPDRSRENRRRFWLKRTIPYSVGVLIVLGVGLQLGIRLDEPRILKGADPQRLVTALKSEPSYWYPWYLLAHLYNNRAEALDAEASPEAELRQTELRSYGMRSLERAAAYNPRDYRIHLEMARARFRMEGGMTDEVTDAFSRAVALAPKQRKVWAEWLRLEVQGGGVEAARRVAETAEEVAPKEEAIHIWKQVLALSKEKEAFEIAYDAVLNITRLAPNNYNMLAERSRLEREMGMTSAAIMSLSKAAELKPKAYKVWMQLGKLELKRGNDLRANEAFTRAKRIRPALAKEIDQIWEEYQGQSSAAGTEGDAESLFEF